MTENEQPTTRKPYTPGWGMRLAAALFVAFLAGIVVGASIELFFIMLVFIAGLMYVDEMRKRRERS